MLLSLFTPTHRTRHLYDTYQSILRQSYRNFEWIIVPNGKRPGPIPEPLLDDERVKVVSGGEHIKTIGGLKRYACHMASGDAFIELDHDDYLMPGDTLTRLADAFQGGAGFVYSDSAAFVEPKLQAHQYAPSHGWEAYKIDIYGRPLYASRTFEITPRSLAEIYYCPDHVRAWSREAYYRAGGHNSKLVVCDDHQLMIKTYLSGAKFEHMGGCYYVYRMFPGNTVKAKQPDIRRICAENKKEFSGELIKEWCRRHDHAYVNLGEWMEEGWKFERDLFDGFGDDVGAIYCDVLQFCPPERVNEFFNVAYQSLRPGGYIDIKTPSTNGQAAFLDPTFKSRFNPASFLLYTRRSLASMNPQINCRYQYMVGFEYYPTDFHEEYDFKYAVVRLCALKGQRQPGLQHI